MRQEAERFYSNFWKAFPNMLPCVLCVRIGVSS